MGEGRPRQALEVNWLIGAFWMDECRGTVEALDEASSTAVEERITELASSHISGMAFEAELSTSASSPSPFVDPLGEEPGYSVVFERWWGTPGVMVSPILTKVPYLYRLLYPHQIEDKKRPSAFGVTLYPFFLQDRRRAYFARPVLDWTPGGAWILPAHPSSFVLAGLGLQPEPGRASYQSANPHLISSATSFGSTHPGSLQSVYFDIDTTQVLERLEISSFYHPFACRFIKALNDGGIPGVLTLANQRLTSDAPAPGQLFASQYHPTDLVRAPHPADDVSFDQGGAYALYNWELFFHAPLFIATQLSASQRYEEAQRWFHYIFDPTTNSTAAEPERFWRVLPLYQNDEYARAQDLLALLAYTGSDATILARKQGVLAQVAAWSDHPFEPHRIARLRLVAYQKSVVMKYIDNLLAWADQLFRRDTIESINEATQLYVLAAEILGRRPERLPSKSTAAPLTYANMRNKLDAFSDVIVKLENVAFPFSIDTSSDSAPDDQGGIESILAAGETLYFCTPDNDKLLGYWDMVADRLFKIRNCMNIEGVIRALPLFEPPIDPALLVRARAAGVDLDSVLSDPSAPLPHYRFTFMLQKAQELCGEVRSLGGLLLSALEKKDGEALAALRATHESSLLKAVRRVKERQVAEAETSLAGLEKTRAITEERHRFYATIPYQIAEEGAQLGHLRFADKAQEAAILTESGAATVAGIPEFTVGGAGFASAVSVITSGGHAAVAALQSTSKILSWMGGHASYKANLAAIKGGWARRWADWKLQERLAQKELAQIDKQIEAAQIRLEIARADLDNTDLQVEHAAAIEGFLRDKYTSQERRHQPRAGRRRALRAQLPRRAISALRGGRRDQPLPRGAAQRHQRDRL